MNHPLSSAYKSASNRNADVGVESMKTHLQGNMNGNDKLDSYCCNTWIASNSKHSSKGC